MRRAAVGIGLAALLVMGVVAALLPSAPMWDATAEIAAGHAALEADDLGVALLHYRRALTIAPREASAQLGAAVVRALRTDIQTEEPGFVPAVARFTADTLSIAELRWLGALLWAATFGLGGVWLWRPGRGLARWGVILGSLATLVLILLIVRRVDDLSRPPAVITAFEVNGLAAPESGAPVLFTLYSAAEARVLAAEGDWVRLALPDGREAWVARSAVGLVEGQK